MLGLPINMDGTEGPRAQATRAFARNLAKLTPLAIVFWDERLSTAAVERMLIDADASRATRDKVVDKLAAAWILQAALDALRQAERLLVGCDGVMWRMWRADCWVWVSRCYGNLIANSLPHGHCITMIAAS